ncbi:MAG: hypothetical protein RL456_1642 [Pseudomonadota bacterium]|jgi:hypothetical protein
MESAPSTVHRVKPVELARMLGVSRQGIHDLVKRNVISTDADGLIDVEMARIAITSRVHPKGKTAAAITNPPPPPGIPAPVPQPADPHADAASATSFHVARTLRESEEARMAKMKRMQLEGSLIDKGPAVTATFTAFRQLRDSLVPIGRRLASRVTSMTPREAQLAYEEELRQALQLWADRTLASLTGTLNQPTGAPVPMPAETTETP